MFKDSRFFSRKPCAGKITQPPSFESGTIQACQGGTQGNVVERSNTVCITMQKSASQQHLSCIKEGWGLKTNNKFETLKQFHPIPAFQNGETEFITKYALEDRLCKLDLKRCLLLCSSKKGINEICTVSLGIVPAPLIFTKIQGTKVLKIPRYQIPSSEALRFVW